MAVEDYADDDADAVGLEWNVLIVIGLEAEYPYFLDNDRSEVNKDMGWSL